MDWMRFFPFLSTSFAMFITVAMGAQHNSGISFVFISLGLTGMMRSCAGFTASTPQHGCCLEGGKGKEDTLFSDDHAVISIRMGWNLGLTRFDAL